MTFLTQQEKLTHVGMGADRPDSDPWLNELRDLALACARRYEIAAETSPRAESRGLCALFASECNAEADLLWQCLVKAHATPHAGEIHPIHADLSVMTATESSSTALVRLEGGYQMAIEDTLAQVNGGPLQTSLAACFEASKRRVDELNSGTSTDNPA